MVGFNYRFNELYQRLRGQITAGRIGNLVHLRSVFSTTSSAETSWRRRSSERRRRAARFGGAHGRRFLRFALSRSEKSWSLRGYGQCATAMTRRSLTWNSRTVSPRSHSSRHGSIEENRIEIFGDRGKLSVDHYASLDVRMTARAGGTPTMWIRSGAASRRWVGLDLR